MSKPRKYGAPAAYTPNSKADVWRKPKQYARQKKAAMKKGRAEDERKD